MTPGNSKIFGSSDETCVRRRAWLIGLLLYALGAGADFAHHLIDALSSGDELIEFSEVAVAFSAALFWPIDIVTARLLTMR
jgi:hypothetical protein